MQRNYLHRFIQTIAAGVILSAFAMETNSTDSVLHVNAQTVKQTTAGEQAITQAPQTIVTEEASNLVLQTAAGITPAAEQAIGKASVIAEELVDSTLVSAEQVVVEAHDSGVNAVMSVVDNTILASNTVNKISDTNTGMMTAQEAGNTAEAQRVLENTMASAEAQPALENGAVAAEIQPAHTVQETAAAHEVQAGNEAAEAVEAQSPHVAAEFVEAKTVQTTQTAQETEAAKETQSAANTEEISSAQNAAAATAQVQAGQQNVQENASENTLTADAQAALQVDETAVTALAAADITTVEEPAQTLENAVLQETDAVKTTWKGRKLTKAAGTVKGPSGKETYYNLDMRAITNVLKGHGWIWQKISPELRANVEGEYNIREDGCKMLGDYIMVAANLNIHPLGSLVETSLGTGVVVDTGAFARYNPNQIDIAVIW